MEHTLKTGLCDQVPVQQINNVGLELIKTHPATYFPAEGKKKKT